MAEVRVHPKRKQDGEWHKVTADGVDVGRVRRREFRVPRFVRGRLHGGKYVKRWEAETADGRLITYPRTEREAMPFDTREEAAAHLASLAPSDG